MSGLDRRPLGRTDMNVPSLCLGTMMYGDQIGEQEAFRQMDRCFEFGIDFFDTAEMYTIPPKAETQGESERIVGRWIQSRGARDRLTLATKVAGRSDMTYLRDKETRVTRDQVRAAVEQSLRNLQTDYVDLYQVHWPDRRANTFGRELKGFRVYDNTDAVPIEEQLQALAELVDEGKVRAIGLSNETAWGVMSFLRAAERHNLPAVASVQNAYNLLNRVLEYGLAEVLVEEKVSLLPYSPIGQGALTGKYLGGARPEGSRGALFERLGRYQTPNAEAAIKAYVDLAADLGVDPVTLSMAFVTTRPWTTSNIFGASNEAQLELILQSVEFDMTKEVLDRINEIHVRYPNPCP